MCHIEGGVHRVCHIEGGDDVMRGGIVPIEGSTWLVRLFIYIEGWVHRVCYIEGGMMS